MICKECKQNPCVPGCPDYKRKQVFICSGCGKGIYEEDYYWNILGEQFCEHCIDKAREVAEYVGDEE